MNTEKGKKGGGYVAFKIRGRLRGKHRVELDRVGTNPKARGRFNAYLNFSKVAHSGGDTGYGKRPVNALPEEGKTPE